MNESLSKQIEELAAAWESVDRIPAYTANRLSASLESAPNEALLLVYRRRVKFCWLVAAMILEERGVQLPD